MKRRARWRLVSADNLALLIQDLGPWDRFPTITNDAENVVDDLVPLLDGRRLFYIDSEGNTDELLIVDGTFAGFAPGPRSREGGN